VHPDKNQQREAILREARELNLSIGLEEEQEFVRVVMEIQAAAAALRGKGMMEEPASVFRLEPWQAR
jgi:hypothetical protein